MAIGLIRKNPGLSRISSLVRFALPLVISQKTLTKCECFLVEASPLRASVVLKCYAVSGQQDVGPSDFAVKGILRRVTAGVRLVVLNLSSKADFFDGPFEHTFRQTLHSFSCIYILIIVPSANNGW